MLSLNSWLNWTVRYWAVMSWLTVVWCMLGVWNIRTSSLSREIKQRKDYWSSDYQDRRLLRLDAANPAINWSFAVFMTPGLLDPATTDHHDKVRDLGPDRVINTFLEHTTGVRSHWSRSVEALLSLVNIMVLCHKDTASCLSVCCYDIVCGFQRRYLSYLL